MRAPPDAAGDVDDAVEPDAEVEAEAAPDMTGTPPPPGGLCMLVHDQVLNCQLKPWLGQSKRKRGASSGSAVVTAQFPHTETNTAGYAIPIYRYTTICADDTGLMDVALPFIYVCA